LNALPLITAFQDSGSDTYLLRTAFGGLSGALSNIDQEGFASASFHSFADTLRWDAYSGDYGPNFVGHVLGIGTYVLNHPDFGWQAFGGNVVAKNAIGAIIEAKDSVRRRVYLASLKTTFTLDAGVFSRIVVNDATVQLTVLAKPAEINSAAPAARGRLVVQGAASPTSNLIMDAGAWVVPFINGSAVVTFIST
jgi:hypothetical protein